MRGIYIHIPFCRQACRYCDFFFTVSLKKIDEFVEILILELESRASQQNEYLMGSIYLGGGTPSVLSSGHLERIMEAVRANYNISEGAEVTVECNPDDLNTSFLEELKRLGVNRLSIGIQSFRDKDLILMRRSHDASRARRSVEEAARAGFNNVTVDLIYGIPGQNAEGWRDNLREALTMPITHLSAYHLTFEPGTLFDHWRKKGRLLPVQEEQSEVMYGMLREELMNAGFEHYEISNFAKHEREASEGFKSRHNQLYWSGEPYLGFGPSAHSFDGTSRSWNVASLKVYMESVSAGLPAYETEHLSAKEQYHDYLITSLRTSRGVQREQIDTRFGAAFLDHFDRNSKQFILKGTMQERGERLIIDPGRWLMADHIMRELFMG
ncbi:MAG: radical SAM family heme chaperone HemW [Bacteroidota bacterium]